MRLRNHLFFYFLLIISKPIVSDELVIEDTFIDYLSNLSSFSASFSQKTYSDQTERVVEGQIRANRKGMFKLTYSEPINEVLLSDGINFHRYDPELEQLEIRPIENLINETPIGLFSAQPDQFFELYNLNKKQMALSCSSHCGEDFHVKELKNWLNKNKTSDEFSTESFHDAKNIGEKMEINEYENKRFIRW